eukprot:8622482-Lingulodinium_polyedra.AAC.1
MPGRPHHCFEHGDVPLRALRSPLHGSRGDHTSWGAHDAFANARGPVQPQAFGPTRRQGHGAL